MTDTQPTPCRTPVPVAVAAQLDDREQAGLRWQALVMTLALIAEYLLGVGVNLYVSVPAGDHGTGLGAAIGKAISHGPAALAIHASVGLLLIVVALALTVRSVAARRWPLAALALAGLVCLLGAAAAGASFVGTGKNGASMMMAVLTGIALACYVSICYLSGASRNAQ